MEHDVDPNDTGSFDQMNLISLIARKPKTVDSLEDMIEAIKVLCSDIGSTDDKDKLKIPVDTLKITLTT